MTYLHLQSVWMAGESILACNQVETQMSDLYRMSENGKIVEHWDVVDKTDFLRTMGLIKFTQ